MKDKTPKKRTYLPRLSVSLQPEVYEKYIDYIETNGYDKSKFTELLLKKFLSTLEDKRNS